MSYPILESHILKIFPQYNKLEYLGKGMNGIVFIATPTNPNDNNKYIIKYSKDLNEFYYLELLKEKCITKYILCIEHYVYDKYLFIVSKYDENNISLDRFVENIQLNNKILIMKKIAEGMEYIHSKGIIHLDLKIGNILINKKTYEPTIIDFGSACVNSIDEDDVNKNCNKMTSFAITAPEILDKYNNGNTESIIDYSADVFSLSYVFYYIITGINYFNTDDVIEHLLKGTFKPFNEPLTCDSGNKILDTLIVKMSALNPLSRPNDNEILETLKSLI